MCFQKIEKFIDESDQGVILVSFGSIAKGSTINEKTLLAFKQAFAEIPQRVIWKYEEQIEDLSNNVMISDWIPQRDILGRSSTIYGLIPLLKKNNIIFCS